MDYFSQNYIRKFRKGNQFNSDVPDISERILKEAELEERAKSGKIVDLPLVPLTQEFASWTAAGDAMELGEIARDIKNQNYLSAGWGIGLLALPGAVGSKIKKILTKHIQGDDAVKMFKEYGGTKIPENSKIGEDLRKYVYEARQKYGLVGNNNITDEEIAESLYKHAFELSGENNYDIRLTGEPKILFRGDTAPYTELKSAPTPKHMEISNGTMDNSLGNLFLGSMPHQYDTGVDHYLNQVKITGMDSNGKIELLREPSSTGRTAGKWPKDKIDPEEIPTFTSAVMPKQIGYPQTHLVLKPELMDTGVNNINAFVVRSPEIRNMTNEMQVLNEGVAMSSPEFKWHTKNKPEIKDEGTFYNGEKIQSLFDGFKEQHRDLWRDQYQAILDEALKNNQGVMVSSGLKPGSKGTHPFRGEHPQYDYFAIPNFNKNNVKHLLPYDLRIPRNWGDPNIYRAILPIIGAGTLATPLILENKNDVD